MHPTTTETELLFHHLTALCCLPNPSEHEDLIREYVIEHLTAARWTCTVDQIGNVLAIRGLPDEAHGYPLLSFHMDSTVFEGFGFPKASRYQPIVEHGRIHSGGQFILGGDDKCGAALALTLAACTNLPLKMVASVQGELECRGIKQVPPSFFADVAYALVLDRRGSHDIVTSIYGYPLCDRAFLTTVIQAAKAVNHSVRSTDGLPSDALELSHHVRNVANLSVGYYKPHSPFEYVVLEKLLHAYRWVHTALHLLPSRKDASNRHPGNTLFP